MDLSQFSLLRSLSWRGLRSAGDFEALRDSLKANCSSLEDLTVDLIDWALAGDLWFTDRRRWDGDQSSNFFAKDILELETGDSKEILPSLGKLSLAAVSFETMVPELISAFNICKLRSLKLWNCPSSSGLLRELTKSGQVIRLTSFELVVDETECVDFDPEPLQGFLKRFQGLCNLYLLVPGPAEWGSIGKGILNHKSTLRCLIMHNRTLDLDELSDRFEDMCDMI